MSTSRFEPKSLKNRKKKKKKKKKYAANIHSTQNIISTSNNNNSNQTSDHKKKKQRTHFADVAMPSAIADFSSIHSHQSGSGRSSFNRNSSKKSKNRTGKYRNSKRSDSGFISLSSVTKANANESSLGFLEKHEQKSGAKFGIKLVKVEEDISDEECNSMSMDTKHISDITPIESPFSADIYAPVTLHSLQTQNMNEMKQSQPPSVSDLFQNKIIGNEDPVFFLMQLPPVLPLEPILNDFERRQKVRGEMVNENKLNKMGQGLIGKIQIRKSGAVQFVIGDGMVLDVNHSSPMNSYQQLMHIHCQNNTGFFQEMNEITGKATVLGQISPENNLVCSYRAEDLVSAFNSV